MTDVDAAPLELDHRFARDLEGLYERWSANEVTDPHLLVLNDDLATGLGLDPAALRRPEGVAMLVGNGLPDDVVTVAQAYAGHQFGGYSPRLGDGRALLVGELLDPAGRRWDLHLKGSGRTPFARGGDGLATVGPMLREYVIAEAMAALGVPTTRSLAVVATGRAVRREAILPGAVLARVASSHLRVGTFQYAASTGDGDLLRRLADHAIARHVPAAADAEHPHLALYEHVVDVQARLVARWMAVGFVHGVMNTDNTTISGETIDYGPCAFLDRHDPAAVFSSIDHAGRYAFGNQPRIAQWNLARLAEAMLGLLADDQDEAIERATAVLDTFPERFRTAYVATMRPKLGLAGADDGDADLVDDLLAVMHAQEMDHTATFRALSSVVRGDDAPLRSLAADPSALDAWLERHRARRADDDRAAEVAAADMDRTNPLSIPRNHLVETALDAAVAGDLGPFAELVDVVTHPFEARPGHEPYTRPAPPDAAPHVTYCGT